MNMAIKRLLGVVGGLALVFAVSGASAAPKDPRVLVEEVTTELFTVVKAHPADSEAYYSGVDKVLDKVVDFRYIAAIVMGRDAWGKATAEQKTRFAEVFKNGLVRSYAKGIAGYADSAIKVVGVDQNAQNAKRAVVRQEVAHEGAVHQLSYTLRQVGEDWRLINVVLNGVNLGQSFSSQFTAALRKEGGDIDKVINNWLSEV